MKFDLIKWNDNILIYDFAWVRQIGDYYLGDGFNGKNIFQWSKGQKEVFPYEKGKIIASNFKIEKAPNLPLIEFSRNNIDNVLVIDDLFLDIDLLCASLEDVLHGEEGNKITKVRYLLSDLHKKIDKTLKKEEGIKNYFTKVSLKTIPCELNCDNSWCKSKGCNRVIASEYDFEIIEKGNDKYIVIENFFEK